MRLDRAAPRRAAALCALLATLGCTAGPSGDPGSGDTGFSLAYLHDDCAPWDGGALTLMLSHVEILDPFDVPYPHLRVSSWRPPSRLPGGTIEWSGTDHQQGEAMLCDSAEACESAVSVRLRFDRLQETAEAIIGDLQVELSGGHVVAGPFEARRIDFVALCG